MLYFCRTLLQRNTKNCYFFFLSLARGCYESSRLVLSSCMMAPPSFPWTFYISLARWNVFIHYVGNECGIAYCILEKIQMLATAVIIVRHSILEFILFPVFVKVISVYIKSVLIFQVFTEFKHNFTVCVLLL
jgi:hypothetical protein